MNPQESMSPATEEKLREHIRQMALATGRDHEALWIELTTPLEEPTRAGRRRDQPLPTITEGGICVQDEVMAYIERRKAIGIERYGTVLQPHNGRDALRDAFEEAVDLTQYLAQALIERDGALPS